MTDNFAMAPRFFVPTPNVVLTDMVVVVENGAISDIKPKDVYDGSAGLIEEYNDTILHPGFVNAHCHLDLTFLAGMTTPGLPFTEWIRELVALRRKTPLGTVDKGIMDGISKLLETGTTSVGNICSTGLSNGRLISSGMRAIVYHEVLGAAPTVVKSAMTSLKDRITSAPENKLVRNGASPHAIYSTSAKLIKEASVYAKSNGLPIATHLCETREETTYARYGTGPFSDFLLAIGIYDAKSPMLAPVAAMESLGALNSALAIHMNHPTVGDLTKLERANASMVWCPGSNKWFGRDVEHPAIRAFTNKRGIAIGLGTDSLASNESLDMAREARLAASLAKDLSKWDVFQMATEGGAKALRLPRGVGVLKVGSPFDAALIETPNDIDESLVADSIMSEQRTVRAVFIDGKQRYKS